MHSGSTGTVTSTARGTDDDGDDVVGVGDEICKRLQENLTLLDHIYPKCKVDLLLVESDEFCPALVAQLSRDLGIQPSFMFIRWWVVVIFIFILVYFCTNLLLFYFLIVASTVPDPIFPTISENSKASEPSCSRRRCQSINNSWF